MAVVAVAAVAAVAVDWTVAVVLAEAMLTQSSKSERSAAGVTPEVPRCNVPGPPAVHCAREGG